MTETAHNELPLIRTKLAPPRIGSAPVARSALLHQLDAQRGRKLCLVLGPAGCGKTMLLTQWRKQLFLQGATVAWYNAGIDDDDVYVAAYLVEAFRQAGLAISNDGLQLFTRSGGKAWKPLLASLVNALQEQGGEIYLFIDDFQYLSSFTILKLIDRWLALAPPGFHLVLASRIRPPLDLSKLRAEDQLAELEFKDLRFSLEETRRFADAQGLEQLKPAQIGALQEITDGWAAGLQLLAFSLRKQKLPEAFLEGQAKLSLSQEEALERYLQQATLEHLQPEELSFLTRVSACRRFNRELCELLTGDPRAAEYLARFEAENLFLMPIDTTDAEPWYRLHRLFASFLNKRLDKLDGAELKKLHQLASHWFAGKGLHREALRHARLAGDNELLVGLIDRVARRMIAGADFIQLLQWCAVVPRELLRTRLEACLCAAWAQVSFGRMDEFERSLEDIASHPACAKPEVRSEVELLKAYRLMRCDDTAGQLRIVEPMMGEGPPAGGMQRLLAAYIAGIGRVYANRFEAARDLVRWHHRADIAGPSANPKPLLEMIQGLSHLVQGHISLAADLLASVIDTAARAAALSGDATGIMVGYLIEARFQQNQVALARALLDQHADLTEAVGAADSVLYSYRVRARIEELDGDAPAALKTLQRLEEFGYREGLDRLVAWSLYEQLLMALRARRKVSLQQLLQRLLQLAGHYRDRHDCVCAEIPLAAALAQAEIAFDEQGAVRAASLAPIEAAAALARANGRTLLSTRLGLMRAILLLQAGERDTALAQARELVALALELGQSRVLPDLGTRAAPLVAALLQQELPPAERACLEALSALQAPPPDGDPAARPAAASTGADVLSAREREVLELLGKALSTKSIARALDLSSGTVKWHLKNIYGKLGAASREDALGRARNLKILI
jgi:LuxR family maltose regulon positive regulatory protein